MAKRRASSAIQTVRWSPPAKPAAPVIKVSVPRPIQAKGVKKKHHRRRSGGASNGGLTITHMAAYVGGGAALGFIENQFGSHLPNIPIVGKKGAVAIIAYMLAKNNFGGQIMRDVAVAAAAVSGYQLGSDGKVTGEGDY